MERIGWILATMLLFQSSSLDNSAVLERVQREDPRHSVPWLKTFARIKGSYRLRRESLVKPGFVRMEEGDFAFDHGFRRLRFEEKYPVNLAAPRFMPNSSIAWGRRVCFT